MWFLLVVVVAAFAGPSPAAFDTATRLIDRLYLDRDAIDEVRLLRAAALRLEEEVPWLRVTFDARRVVLSHGDGTALGYVDATTMEDLPITLRRLTEIVSGADGARPDLVEAALAGLGDALDPYSRLLTEDRLARFNLRLTGLQVGIGAAFVVEHGQATVEAVHPGGPADGAGLRPGDIVVRVDGRPAASLGARELGRRLQGEEGTQVVLEVSRAEAAADAGPERLVLTRAPVVVPNVRHAVLEQGVGYVRIDHVSQRSVANFRAALSVLSAEGALERGLVLDLRQNTGGSMREAARLADLFLSEGLILRTVGRDGRPVRNLDHEIWATPSRADLDVPVVVVVDDRTASGAEILAGALVEHGRAVLVGTRTYGKGSVQKALPVDRGAHFKLTIAEYHLANGRRIAGAGLVPDVTVGRVDLTGASPRLSGFGRAGGSPWRAVPEVVTERVPRTRDLPVEIARKALVDVEDAARSSLLAAVHRRADLARRDQGARLARALESRGVDWSIDGSPGLGPAHVRAWTEPLGEGRHAVLVEIGNEGREPIQRGGVQIRTPSVPELNGQVVLVGRVEPGQTATGRLVVDLPAGLPRFEVDADLALWAEGHPSRPAGSARLALHTPVRPEVRVTAVRRAGGIAFTVHNVSRTPLPDVVLQVSGRADAAPLETVVPGTLVPGAQREVVVEGSIPSGPIELTVASSLCADIARWTIEVPGPQPVVFQAPRVDVHLPAGPLVAGAVGLHVSARDELAVEHVVVWVNGAKVAWAGGGRERVELHPTVELTPGANHVRIVSVDRSGLSVHRDLSLWAHVATVPEAPSG